jgi:GMP synthase (glutamine-hydrolysing)
MGIKIYVVDNGGQWTHREWRVLRDLNVETKIIKNTTPLEQIEVDGLVLSGGAPRVATETQKLGRIKEYVDSGLPILAICVSHQYLAIHFGGKAGPAKIPEYGKMEIMIEEHNDIFKDLPKRLIVWESHNDEIVELPKCFMNLAYSKNCKHQAIKHTNKPIYGLQFHPEVEHTQYGYEIFKNFIKICKS